MVDEKTDNGDGENTEPENTDSKTESGEETTAPKKKPVAKKKRKKKPPKKKPAKKSEAKSEKKPVPVHRDDDGQFTTPDKDADGRPEYFGIEGNPYMEGYAACTEGKKRVCIDTVIREEWLKGYDAAAHDYPAYRKIYLASALRGDEVKSSIGWANALGVSGVFDAFTTPRERIVNPNDAVLHVHDPDGWRNRAHALGGKADSYKKALDEPITAEEFRRRVLECTLGR